MLPTMPQPTSVREPTAELDPRFSDPKATARPWTEARRILDTAQTYWLSTVRSDGRPHVTTVAGVWVDEALHITTGDEEQKRHNLATNPSCVATTGCNGFEGLDVVVEADAVEVVDTDRLQRIADAYIAKYGEIFRFVVAGSHLRLPDVPESVVRCYRLEARKAFGFGKDDPFSQTRWRFDGS
jgi:hypothetical protein